MDIELLSVIVGAVLGAVISSVSYILKANSYKAEKINRTLFHLLEIWSLIGITKTLQGEDFHNTLVDQLRKAFPGEKISTDEVNKLKDGLHDAALVVHANKPISSEYLEKYLDSINDLAPILPLHAYQLGKNKSLIKFLEGIDDMFGEEVSDSDQVVISRMKNFLYNDAFDEFEKDLKLLAKKTGVCNSRKIITFLDNRKSVLKHSQETQIRDYLITVIGPLIQEHYDSLGIPNPNTQSHSGKP
ncbi:hypothetical protein [uncultured Methylophaga sp.]|uniref:hypothetical protein n=1 Tax=uncultured Methylophaga sp. TaxID=285271 RepID=UPI00262C5A85|nr:hypothetical protein [uncultured Methylophaga sp.]